jgi:hypothetical protein
VKRRTALILTGVLFLAVPGTALAGTGGDRPSGPRLLAPAAIDLTDPMPDNTADSVPDSPQISAGQSVVPSGPQLPVDAQTYRQQKAAALWAKTSGHPTAVNLPHALPPQAAMPRVFDGMDFASAGGVFVPPDTTMGKSSTHIVEAANTAIRLFSTTGTVQQTRSLNSFFGVSTTNGRLFDPKVYFDRNASRQRFYVAALQAAGIDDANSANDVSRLFIAVSRSSNPSTLASSGWCRYNIDARRDVGTVNASWADFPALGVGRDSFSVDTNQFRFTDRTVFTFAEIRVFNKNVAANNSSSCPRIPRFTFQPASSQGDSTRFTIQPAQHYTSPTSFTAVTNPAYYLSTSFGSSDQYHVFRVANVAGGHPTLAETAVTGAGYSVPPNGGQPSGAIVVDSGADEVLQVAGIGDNITGEFTTACNFTPGTPNESCTLTPRVTVGHDASGNLTATIAENPFEGLGDGVFVHHPSVASNSALQSGGSWEFNGASANLSTVSLTKNVNDFWFTVQTYASGTCVRAADPPSTTTARAGDYTGAQTDPGLTTFWTAGEEAVTVSGTCLWRTRIGSLTP